MSSSDEIEQFHQSKILLTKNSYKYDSNTDSDSSNDENTSTEYSKMAKNKKKLNKVKKFDYETTHEMVQYHLDEEKRNRERFLESSDGNESEDEVSEGNKLTKPSTFDNFGKKTKDWYGSDKIKNIKVSRAEHEQLEEIKLNEAIQNEKTIEKLIQKMNYVDPELEPTESENEGETDEVEHGQHSIHKEATDQRETSIDENENRKFTNQEKQDLIDESNPNIKKYMEVHNYLVLEQLPAVDKNLTKKSQILPEILLNFLKLKKTLILDYLTTISLYLAMSFEEKIENYENVLYNHPVIARLKKFEKMFGQYFDEKDDYFLLDSMIEEIGFEDEESENEGSGDESEQEIGDEIEDEIGDEIEDEIGDEIGDEIEDEIEDEILKDHVYPRKSNPDNKLKQKHANIADDDPDYKYYIQKLKEKHEKAVNLNSSKRKANLTGQSNEEEDPSIPPKKREITKEIKQNKGHIASKKKKIDRNPRVKLREKFRRANIKRKGQVKSVRNKNFKYDGEYSGIRTGVTSGRKID